MRIIKNTLRHTVDLYLQAQYNITTKELSKAAWYLKMRVKIKLTKLLTKP